MGRSSAERGNADATSISHYRHLDLIDHSDRFSNKSASDQSRTGPAVHGMGLSDSVFPSCDASKSNSFDASNQESCDSASVISVAWPRISRRSFISLPSGCSIKMSMPTSAYYRRRMRTAASSPKMAVFITISSGTAATASCLFFSSHRFRTSLQASSKPARAYASL